MYSCSFFLYFFFLFCDFSLWIELILQSILDSVVFRNRKPFSPSQVQSIINPQIPSQKLLQQTLYHGGRGHLICHCELGGKAGCCLHGICGQDGAVWDETQLQMCQVLGKTAMQDVVKTSRRALQTGPMCLGSYP